MTIEGNLWLDFEHAQEYGTKGFMGLCRVGTLQQLYIDKDAAISADMFAVDAALAAYFDAPDWKLCSIPFDQHWQRSSHMEGQQ